MNLARPLSAEEMLLQHQAQAVVHRQVQLLYHIGLIAGHDQRKIRHIFQPAAGLSAQGDDLHALRLCHDAGVVHVFRVSGGGDGQEHIPGAAQNAKLLWNDDGSPTARTGKILAATPMGRFGKPEELIGALLYFTDDACSKFVTGVVLPIDGGFNAYSGV